MTLLAARTVTRLTQRLKARRPRLGERGQSTLEFALTLFLLMAFLLFYVQLSLLLGYGNYAQYATFMAARAYLSAGANQSDQAERARTVIIKTLKRGEGGQDRFPSIAKGDGDGEPKGVQIGEAGNFSPTNPDLSWLQGVRYRFKGRLFVIPIGTGPAAAQASRATLTLQSESWLGREPAYDECQSDLNNKGIFDNGC
jgi:hypothetical protein